MPSSTRTPCKHRLTIPSRSGPHHYCVTEDYAGHWRCDCKDWLYRKRPCWHIRQAQLQVEAGTTQRTEPHMVFAHVETVTRHDDHTLYVPLLPIGDTHFLATLCFDLYRHGIRWTSIQAQYRLPEDWTKAKVFHYIDHFGRKVYHFSGDPPHTRTEYRIERTWELPDIPHHQETPEHYHERTGMPLDLARHMFTSINSDPS